MDTLLKATRLLGWSDWSALCWFFSAWWGYAHFARRRAEVQPSILAATNRIRRQWMLQATYRDVRVVDGVVVQNLSSSPSFFASTTILILGGLLALLSASDQASALVSEIPFAQRSSGPLLHFKLLVLTGIFVYAFFRFSWSLRQYTFGALLVASAPDYRQFEALGDAAREAFADRAGRVVGLAAETFNDGLRAYYMAFAGIAWFFSALAFAIAAGGVIWILYQREFRSEVLDVLRG